MKQNAIPWRYRLEVRQSVPILIGLAGVLVLLLSLGYLHAREQILATARGQLTQLEGNVLRQEDYHQRWIERGMQSLVRLAATIPGLPPEEQKRMDKRIASSISDEYGHNHVEIFFLDDKGDVILRRYNTKGLLYAGKAPGSEWNAQTIPTVTRPLWHPPELNAEGNLTLHYSAPLVNEAAEPGTPNTGICCIIHAIPQFPEQIIASSTLKNCIPFFMDHNGAWTLHEQLDSALEKLKKRILAAPYGVSNLLWKGRSYTAVYMPLTGGSLRMGVLIPRANLFGNLDRLTRTLGLIGLTVLLLAAYSLHRATKTVLSPFASLGKLAERLAKGELESTADASERRHPPRFPDEAQRLRMATESLRLALRQRVGDLTLVGQTRERLFGELTFARTLQESLRPQKLPPTPGLELDAFVHTAGNVCGDMYDYFFLSPQQLCCIMGNAVERGVPAALLTGRVIPLLHELLLSGISPGKALENANRILAPDFSPKQSMVSALVGVLDIATGRFHWACAGQLPPFRSLAGQVEQLAWTGNVPLGIRSKEQYAEQEICLRPGELLFFTEQRLLSTSSPAGKAYGEEALQRFLAGRKDGNISELLHALYAEIRTHVGGPPLDDLTFFAVRWLGAAAAAERGLE